MEDVAPQVPAPTRVWEVIRNARRNALKREIPWEIEREHVERLWGRCGGYCELSGIEFDLGQTVERGRRRPFAPSLDRVDCGKGYTHGNVRLICVVANIALNEWGIGPLLELAEALIASKREAEQSRIAGVIEDSRGRPLPLPRLAPDGYSTVRDYFPGLDPVARARRSRVVREAAERAGVEPFWVDVPSGGRCANGTFRRTELAWPVALLEYAAEHFDRREAA